MILSAQPAKYLMLEIAKLTSTLQAQSNVLPTNELHWQIRQVLREEIPLSRASRAANSSKSRCMSSASFHSKLDLRPPGAFSPQVVSNAFCAASTAMSTSSSVASETFVINRPLAGRREMSIRVVPKEMLPNWD